jgi:hypothetical protein
MKLGEAAKNIEIQRFGVDSSIMKGYCRKTKQISCSILEIEANLKSHHS